MILMLAALLVFCGCKRHNEFTHEETTNLNVVPEEFSCTQLVEDYDTLMKMLYDVDTITYDKAMEIDSVLKTNKYGEIEYRYQIICPAGNEIDEMMETTVDYLTQTMSVYGGVMKYYGKDNSGRGLIIVEDSEISRGTRAFFTEKENKGNFVNVNYDGTITFLFEKDTVNLNIKVEYFNVTYGYIDMKLPTEKNIETSYYLEMTPNYALQGVLRGEDEYVNGVLYENYVNAHRVCMVKTMDYIQFLSEKKD